MRIDGFHGLTRGPIVGKVETPFFVAYDLALAYFCAEEYIERVVRVAVETKAPKVFEDPIEFNEVWQKLRQENPDVKPRPGRLGIALSYVFAQKYQQAGYDAILFPHQAFQSELGHKYFGGTFGDPQILVLNPDIVTITADPSLTVPKNYRPW